MPSTFTSNTGIEKIADGEQTGAWGQTTNDNFDIVDRALNGSVNVTLSGTTHTLTTSDGLLSDGQAAVLVFTGTPSGTNTVTIAPNTAQKTYFVTNSTAQTVVLSQGSGANVSVPAGLSKIVFTNGAGAGAAVFDITNSLSGTFTGNVTGNVTGNASTATALQNARTIGGVSFDGTANINLPGVNQAGNQNTTGSAASLTTARTINGVSFNGTANITLPTVNTSGDQTVAGTKTFSSAVVLSTAGTTTTQAVRGDRTITTGTGLTGGGDLTANRTFAIDIASQAEAETGTDNAHVMTPLRVKQSIDALASGGFSTRVRLNGSGTYTVPAGVTRIRVYIVGGGGGGGARNGGGGGGGGLNIQEINTSAGATFSYASGAGGSGGFFVDASTNAPGTAGGATTFGAFSAGGGGGGGTNLGAGGVGGAGGGTGCRGNGGGRTGGNVNATGPGGGSGGFGGGGEGNGIDGGGGGGSNGRTGGAGFIVVEF